jgi:hypothetical protein
MTHPNLGKLMIMNIGFLMLWSSFNTAQSLAGQTMEDNGLGNLGFYSLSVLCGFTAIGCFIAVPVVNKQGFRFSLMLGGMTYTLYVSVFLLPSYREETGSDAWYLSKLCIWIVVLLVSAINGVGASILWVAGGNYISECANNSNKGLFNSIFWCFLMSSSIVGNLMAAYVVDGFKESVFYIVMTALCFCSALWFGLVTPV